MEMLLVWGPHLGNPGLGKRAADPEAFVVFSWRVHFSPFGIPVAGGETCFLTLPASWPGHSGEVFI